MICQAPLCSVHANGWPTILIGCGGGAPYRIEVPRAVCPIHQVHFSADVFITDAARIFMREFAAGWGMAEPDFDQVEVQWQPLDHPSFAELDGTETRFCAPAQAGHG